MKPKIIKYSNNHIAIQFPAIFFSMEDLTSLEEELAAAKEDLYRIRFDLKREGIDTEERKILIAAETEATKYVMVLLADIKEIKREKEGGIL